MSRSGDANRDELNGIQRQINQRTDESLESTRRMVVSVAEAQKIGTDTMIMLDGQGEQLNRIEEGHGNIHVGMDEAEGNLTDLQKFLGLCVLPWNRRRRHRHRRTHRPSSSSSTTTSSDKSSPTATEPKLHKAGEQGMPSSGYVARITNDNREKEMDENLQIVSSYVGNLKNIALDMRDTISKHSKQLDHMAEETDAAKKRVDAANKETQNILRKP